VYPLGSAVVVTYSSAGGAGGGDVDGVRTATNFSSQVP